MYFKKIKIGNSFLILLVLYFLGYTHFLGGPYGVARFFFIGILIGTGVLILSLWAVARFTKKVLKNQMNNFDENVHSTNEPIKVDAKIVE
jgi:hypothetical protein